MLKIKNKYKSEEIITMAEDEANKIIKKLKNIKVIKK